MTTPTSDRILEVGLGFQASKVLLSAIEMRLFTELARAPGDVIDLRHRLRLHPRAARDFFDALVALGFLQREEGVYRNTPETDLFLDREKPTYIGDLLEMAGVRLYPSWAHLTEALRTGQPQTKQGGDHFAALYADSQRLTGFLRAMTDIGHAANQALAHRIPWAGYLTFVDVGTAQGDLAVQIAKANPHLSGIGFDREPVGPIFADYVAEHGLSERLRFVAGDLIDDDLPGADVILMGHVLHYWSLTQKHLLIEKAYEALPDGGTLVVYDALIDDQRCQNAFGLLMSLDMLIETPAGFDYTGEDAHTWMKAAGFREIHVEHLAGPDSMVVAIK